MGIKNRKFDKNTPQIGDLLVPGKQDFLFINVGTVDKPDMVRGILPAIVIRADKDEIWLSFPLSGNGRLKTSKRSLRFQIKQRHFHLQKANKKKKK